MNKKFLRFSALLLLTIPLMFLSEEKKKVLEKQPEVKAPSQETKDQPSVSCGKQDNGELSLLDENQTQNANTCLFVGCNGFF